jgi:hypothetical protein
MINDFALDKAHKYTIASRPKIPGTARSVIAFPKLKKYPWV